MIATGAAGADGTLPADAYHRAESLRAAGVVGLVRNLTVTPIWLPDGDRFWFQEQSATGVHFVAVDPARHVRQPAFDHGRLAAAISSATGAATDPDHLALTDLVFLDSSSQRLRFTTSGKQLTCSTSPTRCEASPLTAPNRAESLSPDGRHAVFARADNLWVRDLATGSERQLTSDGEPHFAYGKIPDAGLVTVLQQSSGMTFGLYGVRWSPDGQRLVATRVDERKIPDYHFLQSVPYDGSRRPKLISFRMALTGEPAKASVETSIIDASSGVRHTLATGADGLSAPLRWSTDGRRFLALQGGDFSRNVTVFDVDALSGTLRKAFSEDSATFLQVSPLEYDEPAIRYLPATEELIWFSQRDGWGHLYLVDVRSGRIKARLGEGPWSVQNIVRVDETRRVVYFTAVGREPGEDPYLRHLYSVGFDGRGLRLLTPEPGDHDFPPVANPAMRDALAALGMFAEAPVMFSPSGRYFIDSWSTVDRPPEYVVRAADGRVVMPLVRADASAAMNAGWIAPEPFQATAADGKTALYGFLIKPAGFDPAKRYPIVEVIYNGPQVVTTAHSFAGALGDHLASSAQSFAQLGFVSIVMDGRGTELRSKAFQDYMYNNMQEFALEDHVAALRELAAHRPYMDLARLGVIGHSFGGFAAMKAILGYPDFYKAAVASAGPYDMYGMYALDAFFEPPKFDPAGPAKGPFREPSNWGSVDLTRQAGQLKGKLLLAYGDLDENAYPAVSARMVNALIAANKEFDLIYLPNRSHAFSGEPYFIRRSWDFFVRSLINAEPPKDYAFAAPR